MKIWGVVEKEATVVQGKVQYQVKSGEKCYDIISKDRQAVKDLIFLREGQNIEVDVIQKNQDYLSRGSIIEL
ncbi:MAG: hypothetical protein MJ110_01010 [Lachnospiraceae bacterium]|nr:hypothetical protein [Lachnospiraceae bacterium]